MENVAVYGSGMFLVFFLLWIAYQFYGAWHGRKCTYCKCRAEKWLQWHQMKQDDYRGWIWCPNCFRKNWQGFQDNRGFC